MAINEAVIYDNAQLALLDNPHGSNVAACAKAPPSCTGTFPGVPVYDSATADAPSAAVLGCVGAQAELPAATGCPVQLPIPGSGTITDYQFWVVPGGPTPTGHNKVVECRQKTDTRSCGAYIPANYGDSVEGCFSQAKAANVCPTESIAGFAGSGSNFPKYYANGMHGDPAPGEYTGTLNACLATYG
jgi:hypothetical protein